MGNFNPKLPTKYSGTDKYITFFVKRNRSPTGADYRQPETGNLYSIGTIWQVSKSPTTGTEGDMWILSKIVANVAYWVKGSSGVIPTGAVLTLSDTANTLVYPTVDGNIQLYGTAGQIDIVSDPPNNKIIFSLPGGSGAVDSFQVDAFTGPGTNPVLPTALGLVTITGGQVAAGTMTNVIRTDSLAANTFTIEVQRSQAVASSTIGDNGVCHFNSNHFTVDGNGFVSATATPFVLNYTNVTHAMSPYTVLSTDQYLSVDSSGGVVTLNFPNAPAFKRIWVVKDRTGSASTSNITLTTPGGTDTIDGLTSYVMAGNYDSVSLLANATPNYEVW